jgi:tripartite-type tricarboxylate transporter receptor subunit TctC
MGAAAWSGSSFLPIVWACRDSTSPSGDGLWAPKGVPKDIIGRLDAAVVEALADPPVRQRLADLGHEFFPRDQMTPEALAAYQKAEIEKWWPIIKAAGIKGE